MPKATTFAVGMTCEGACDNHDRLVWVLMSVSPVASAVIYSHTAQTIQTSLYMPTQQQKGCANAVKRILGKMEGACIRFFCGLIALQGKGFRLHVPVSSSLRPQGDQRSLLIHTQSTQQSGVTSVETDVPAQRVVVTATDGGTAATAEAMLAALQKWCVCCVCVHGSNRDWVGD